MATNVRSFASCSVEAAREIPQEIENLLYDPQTSGGLLISLSEADASALGARIPWIADKVALAGRPTAYVCFQGRCELPVHEDLPWGILVAPPALAEPLLELVAGP